MSSLARLKRDLAEERGNLRAAAAMIALSGATFVLGARLMEYLIGFFVLPFAVVGAVFGLALTIHYGLASWKLSRQIGALPGLPAARVIQR